MDLLFTIFLLVFVTQLISWIGQSFLHDSACALYLRLFHSSKVSKQRDLKASILVSKQELMQTSSQDQFAKWAKLRRKVDKGLADLEKLNSELAQARSAFGVQFKTALWLFTGGAQFFVGWWFRKQPVFYLPPGWLGPATWWLALPFAPHGSVSCGAWQMACRRVIKVLEGTVKEFIPQPTSGFEDNGIPPSPTTEKQKVDATS